MLVQSYLFFDGRCDEAIEFYKKALGAEVVMLMRFKDSPDPSQCAPGSLDKVMHTTLKIGDTLVLASDGECKGKTNFQGFALVLNVANEAEADKKFNAVGAGGQVVMPLAKMFFSPRFGMTTDKFGVMWMIIVEDAAAKSKAA